jgi:hypothetical protein
MSVVTSLSLFCNLLICAILSLLCLKFYTMQSNNPMLLTLTCYRKKPQQLHLSLYKTTFIQIIFSKSVIISNKTHRNNYGKNSWLFPEQN